MSPAKPQPPGRDAVEVRRLALMVRTGHLSLHPVGAEQQNTGAVSHKALYGIILGFTWGRSVPQDMDGAMQYRNLGRSGLKVSPLGVGTMTWGKSTDQQEANRIAAAALDRGINFFDTADCYNGGVCEPMVSAALGSRRDEAVVATKFAFPMSQDVNGGGTTRRYVMHACEQSLRRLNTEWIDLYQVHFMHMEIPLEETLGALNDLVRQGKVRYIGCSKFVPAYLVEAIMISRMNGWAQFVSEQSPYNLLDRGVENEQAWACLRHGVGIIPWAPLATGMLSGKEQTTREKDGRHRRNGEAKQRAEELKSLADKRGVTLAQFSLAWLMQRPAVTAPIVGMRTADHLHASVAAIDVELTDAELTQVDRIVPPGSYVSNYWDMNTHRRTRAAIGIGA